MKSHVIKMYAAAILLLWMGMAGATGDAVAADSPLQQTLAHLDAASQKFTAAQASFEWDTFQRIINDTDKQYGNIWFKRTGSGTEMRADVSDAPGAKPGQIVIYAQSKLELYQPMIDEMKVFSAGKNSGQYESFLTLGFGGSGTDLTKNWTVTYIDSEMMRGVKVTQLDLKPLQPSVAKMFTHVTIWVDESRGISLQQKFFYPSGDYRTAIYSNISDKGVDGSRFQMPTTKKTKIDVMK